MERRTGRIAMPEVPVVPVPVLKAARNGKDPA